MKKLFTLWLLFLCLVFSAFGQTVSISNIQTTSNQNPPFCAESQVAITINNSGYVNGDFYVEISDENGDFSSPVTITNAIGVGLNKLVGQLPVNLSGGTGYKVRIRHSSGNYSTNESDAFEIQANAGDPNDWGNNEWFVAVYNDRYFTNYRGYYTENQLDIDTELQWDKLSGPADASTYQGCSVGNDNFSFKYRRKGFPCGFYKLSVTKHDDEASLWVNGAQVWTKTGTCNPCSSDNDIWEGWLGIDSEVEFRVDEAGGHAHGGVDFVLSESNLVEVSPHVTICLGATAFLTATSDYSVTYEWNPTTDLNITSGQYVEASPNVTTIYRVTATETISGCYQTDFVTVTVDNISNTQAVQPTFRSCPDGTIELQATGANTYEWSPTSTLSASTGNSVFASPNTTTIYQVIGSNGCHFSTAFITVEVGTPAGIDDSIWGQDSWNAYAYDSRDETTNTSYSDYSRLFGMYTEPDLNIDTRDYWGTGASPSDASNYVGCVVTKDYHEVRYKREGFPCDLYQIDVPYHDDGYSLQIDGTQVSTDNTWFQNNPKINVWRGFLTDDTQVLFQFQEGGGGAGGAVNFTPINLVEDDYMTFCVGETITLTVPTYDDVTYSWSGANLNSTTGASVTATPAGNTNYQVIATHTPSGCTETGFITVEIETQTLTVTPLNSTICGGGSATLSASGAVSYTWSSGSGYSDTGTDVTVSPAFTTSYRVDAQFCALSFATAFVTVTVGQGNPDEFGDNEWYVYGYNGRSFAQYYGRYIEPNLTFNSRDRWSLLVSPSDATGYIGCTIPIDQHSVSYKRKGFPCAYYQINIINNDDEAWLYVDGVEVWSIGTCCSSHGDVWRGFLGANSEIEFRWGEGGGGSHGGVEFVELPDETIETSSKKIRICETTTTTMTATTPTAPSAVFTWTKSKDDSFLSFNTTSGNTVIATANQNSEVFVTVSMYDPVSGCSSEDVFFITIDPLPATTVNMTYAEICLGETLNFEVEGANLYTWTANTSDAEAGFSTVAGTKSNYQIEVTPTESTIYYIEGNNNCASLFQTITVDVIKPAFAENEYGDGEWYVFAYEGNSFDLTQNSYRGNYTQGSIADLSFDSKTMWGTSASPSDAPNYVGCDVPKDNHLVSYKRKNFPCGWYRIHVVNHDDGMKLFVNGTEVFSATGCCKSHYGAWEGFLDENATVEFQWSEGGGGSNGSLQFEYTLSSSEQTVWKGSVNNDWFNALNWCDEIPTKDMNVLIPKNNVPNMPQINQAGAECNHIEIATGASLEIAGNEEFTVYGNWNNNGFLTANSSTVSFFGTANTQIEGNSYDEFYAVNLEKTGAKLTLNKNVETQYLQMITGVIDLQNNSLSVSADNENSITRTSGLSYIYSENQTGTLCRNLASGTGIYEFPFGKSDTEFISVRIEKNANLATQICISTWGTTPDNLSAPTGVPLDVDLGGSVLNVIDRWWDISSSVNPLPTDGLNLMLSYSASENTSPMPTNPLRIQHYDPISEKWDDPFPFTINGVIAGIGTAYAENVNKFSPFTIIQGPFALPVELRYFEAVETETAVKLRWETSLEINHRYFTIERSLDGKNFEKIGQIDSNTPNSQYPNFYHFTDENPFFGTSYYRLRQTDTDGSETLFKIVSVNFEAGKVKQTLQIFPNPTNSDNVNLRLKADTQTEIKLILTDVLGQIIFEQTVKTDEAGIFHQKINLPQNLKYGVYQLMSIFENGEIVRKKVVLY